MVDGVCTQIIEHDLENFWVAVDEEDGPIDVALLPVLADDKFQHGTRDGEGRACSPKVFSADVEVDDVAIIVTSLCGLRDERLRYVHRKRGSLDALMQDVYVRGMMTTR